jgi:hypothetical protein
MPRYSDRLISFIDILGWSRLLEKSVDNDRLLRSIDSVAKTISDTSTLARGMNPLFKKLSKDLSKNLPEGTLPVHLGLQATHFSDTIVFSSPSRKEYSTPLVAITMGLAFILLRGGYYVRGALTRGLLRHTKSTIYGPAIVRAHNIEQKVAIYPRIVITPDVIDLIVIKDAIREDTFDATNYLDILYHAKPDDLPPIKEIIKQQMILDSDDLSKMQKHKWFFHYLEETESKLLENT